MNEVKENFIINRILNYKYKIVCLMGSCLLYMGISIAKTTYMGKYVDFLIDDFGYGSLLEFVKLLFILGMISIIVGIANQYFSAKMQANIVFDINYELLEHIKKLPLEFFRGKDSFYINQRVNSDSNVVATFILSLCMKTITLLIYFISLFFILIRLDICITIVVYLGLPIYVVFYNLLRNSLYVKTLKFKEAQNRLFSFMGKQLKNISYIKLNSLYEQLNEKFKEEFPRFFLIVQKYLKTGIFFGSLSNILENLFNIFLFTYAGVRVIDGTMTVGEFIAIQGYYKLVMSSIEEAAGLLKQYPDYKVSYARLMEIWNTPRENKGEMSLNNINSIKVKDLVLAFHEQSIFNRVSCEFKKGKIYLLKGKNGIGKSTLIRTILGLYISEMNGNIWYNDYNIRDIDLYCIRKNHIAIIDQDSEFFFDSVEGNISINISEFNVQKMQELAMMFNLQISNQKYASNITSSQLSGGERQKIAIIRALLKNPQVLLMDEPTSALDNKSVDIMLSEIKKKKGERITIIISHDKRCDSIADKIIFL